MNFSTRLDSEPITGLAESSLSVIKADVERMLSSDKRSWRDIAILLSPAAEFFLEEMAQKAAAITARRFGKVIQMYIPLYLSNECSNSCLYCGYRHDQPIKRYTLSMEEIAAEASVIKKMGFSHILLVTGTSPGSVGMDYLVQAIKLLKKDFVSVTLEIPTLEETQYHKLLSTGAEGVTIFQETYHREIYSRVHPSGSKANFEWRTDAPDRIGKAGMRKISLGFLLGLGDWRYDAVALAMHCDHIYHHYWKTALSINFPRITNHPEDFKITPVSDKQLVQLLLAFRLVFPDLGLVVSTRERAELRNRLIPLGVTQISAGSKTTPGGYAKGADERDGQFNTEDKRSPEEIAIELRKMGYEPVWKDWEQGL
jgi:2-iminoacetate synthase